VGNQDQSTWKKAEKRKSMKKKTRGEGRERKTMNKRRMK
jgi:hypothetical protein